jgi:hypothetical protein
LVLDSLHPLARQGALECGAIAGTARTLGASRETITDHDSFVRVLHGPAHYLGQSATVPFQIAGRSYHGRVEFAIALGATGMIDPATHAPFPEPAVLAGCWLTLNGRPASVDGATAALLATPNNVHAVTGASFVAAMLPAAAPAAKSSLAARGNFFVPQSVGITATLGGGAGDAASGMPASSSNTLQVPRPITASSTMQVTASYVVPAPITDTAPLAAVAGYVTPRSVSVDAPMGVAAGFVVPAPISRSGSLPVEGTLILP